MSWRAQPNSDIFCLHLWFQSSRKETPLWGNDWTTNVKVMPWGSRALSESSRNVRVLLLTRGNCNLLFSKIFLILSVIRESKNIISLNIFNSKHLNYNKIDKISFNAVVRPTGAIHPVLNESYPVICVRVLAPGVRPNESHAAESFLRSQQLLSHSVNLWNPKTDDRDHKNPPPLPALSHVNQSLVSPYFSIRNILNALLTSGFLCVLHAPQSHPWADHSNCIWKGIQIIIYFINQPITTNSLIHKQLKAWVYDESSLHLLIHLSVTHDHHQAFKMF
jgi:hypothetical protein